MKLEGTPEEFVKLLLSLNPPLEIGLFKDKDIFCNCKSEKDSVKTESPAKKIVIGKEVISQHP